MTVPEVLLSIEGVTIGGNVNGRFTSVDPGQASGSVTDPQGWNAYAYARNNPLRFWDPTGTDYVIKLDGHDSVMISDSSFHKLQDDPGSGFRLWLGNVQQLQNGVWVTIGTYHYYDLSAKLWADVAHRTEPMVGVVEVGGFVFGWAAMPGVMAAATAASDPTPGNLAMAALPGLRIVFKTAHYASRLAAAGLNVLKVEAAVEKTVRGLKPVGECSGRMVIDGVLIQWRAFVRGDGTVSVGTIHPVWIR